MKNCYTIGIGLDIFQSRFKNLNFQLRSKIKCNYSIVGVNGYELNKKLYDDDINFGQIGCSLSHVQAYDFIVRENLPWALVVEDDISIPSNIEQIIDEVIPYLPKKGVISFYSPLIKPVKYTLFGDANLKYGSLLAPVETFHLSSASAYLISHDAASEMCNINKNGLIIADHWWVFNSRGALDQAFLYHKTSFRVKYLKSSIGYSSKIPILKNIPILGILIHKLLQLRFAFMEWQQLNNVRIVSSKPYVKNP